MKLISIEHLIAIVLTCCLTAVSIKHGYQVSLMDAVTLWFHAVIGD